MSSQSDTPASAMTPGAAAPATVDNSTSERRPGQGRRGGRGRRYYQQGRRGPGRQQGVTAETTPGAPSGTSQTAQAGPSPGIASLPPRPQRTWNPRWVPQKPRPNLTHFISIPLGHIPEFRETLTTFTNDLLATRPKIPGLDRSIVLSARRMHFTLGTMSLEAKEEDELEAPAADSAQSSESASNQQPEHTLEAATRVLNDIKEDVKALLHGEKLSVSLDSMDIMRPEKGNPERAHVMWVGPTPGANNDRFLVVAKFIQNAFRDAGLLVDEDRKLKLHCTVINSIYRKPRAKNRIPFSYTAILASDAVKSLVAPDEFEVVSQASESASDSEDEDELEPPSAATTGETENGKGSGQAKENKAVQKGPTAVDLGDWECDEIQICEMGSWGPEGEYVAAARISLD